MWRHITQIAIAFSIFGLYSIFLFTDEMDSHSVVVSNFVGFLYILSFVIEIRSNKFLRKESYNSFTRPHLPLIIKRISTFYRTNFLWVLIFLPPLLILFSSSMPASHKLIIALLSICQNIFSVYLFITLYDFIEMKGFGKHITNLPAILAIIMAFARNNNHPEIFYINPFGGLINLPLLEIPYLYLLPIMLFIILYLLNKYYIHKYWVV